MKAEHQEPEFQGRTMTKVLFAVMLLLVIAALMNVLLLRGEVTAQWLQVGLIVMMMGLTLLEFRRMTARIRKLAAVAQSIGKGHYQTRSQEVKDDAIGSLGQVINLMAERIQESMAQIESTSHMLKASKEELDKQNRQLSFALGRQSQFRQFLSDLNSIDINTLVTRALEDILQAAGAQLGTFFLWSPEEGQLECLASRGLDSRALDAVRTRSGRDGFAAEVFERKKPIFVEDLPTSKGLKVDFGLAEAELRCIYGLPVSFRGESLGVIVMASFERPDRNTLEHILNHIDALANALKNALSYKAINQQSILLERANQELRQADRMRSEFVANMSHELRTPLNSIIGFSGILLKNRDGHLGEAELKRVEKINRNGRNLLDLINDILDLSKIEAGRMELSTETVDIQSLAREVADLLSTQAHAKSIQIRVEPEEGEPIPCLTDGLRLRQVLINLAGNAIKFTRQGEVVIHVVPPTVDSRHVRIEVRDTGIGIPAEKLEQIFEAFRQADSSTTREFGGTGLGLTISKSMIELMGGTLKVSSVEGEGSCFTVEMPLEPGGGLKVLPSEFKPAPRAGSGSGAAGIRATLRQHLPIAAGQKVLVVDDDPDARDLISHYVQEVGATPIACGKPKEVLGVAQVEKPDLITLDIMMAERSGWEVLGDLKSHPEFHEIPVVIISIVADRQKAVSLGALDAVTKPITRDAFQAGIARNLKRNPGKTGKVLVVDDDPDARAIMQQWIEADTADCRMAENGADALKVLEAFHPDVIFLDLNMPVMDGFTFLGHLRSMPKHEKTPVIILSARTLSGEERRQLERQADRILMKGEAFSIGYES